MVIFSQRLVDERRAVGYVFGHAGDGNLHVVMVGNPTDPGEWNKLEKINHAIVTRAVELGAHVRVNMGSESGNANSCTRNTARVLR